MRFNKLLVLLLIVGLAVVFVSGCGNSRIHNAKARAETILKGITAKDGVIIGDGETAVCMWYANKYRLDGRTLDHASNEFDKWMNEGNLPSKLDSYTITEVKEMGHSIVVSGTINGSPFKWRMPDERPVTWVQTPDLEPLEGQEGEYEDDYEN